MVIQRLFLLSGKAADGCREGMASENSETLGCSGGRELHGKSGPAQSGLLRKKPQVLGIHSTVCC